MNIFTLGLVLTFASVPLASGQTVFVVDDDPGPRVDFTTIGAALAVATARDLIDVGAGVYPRFDANGAARIMGRFGVQVTGVSRVLNTPRGHHLAL